MEIGKTKTAKCTTFKGSTFSFPGSPGFFLWKKLPCFHSHYWTHNILTPFSFQFIEVWTLGCVIPFNHPNNLRQFEVYQYKGGTKSFEIRILLKNTYNYIAFHLYEFLPIFFLSNHNGSKLFILRISLTNMQLSALPTWRFRTRITHLAFTIPL